VCRLAPVTWCDADSREGSRPDRRPAGRGEGLAGVNRASTCGFVMRRVPGVCQRTPEFAVGRRERLAVAYASVRPAVLVRCGARYPCRSLMLGRCDDGSRPTRTTFRPPRASTRGHRIFGDRSRRPLCSCGWRGRFAALLAVVVACAAALCDLRVALWPWKRQALQGVTCQSLMSSSSRLCRRVVRVA
jgi:hypothetical protein